MSTFLTVFLKELRDAVRDRRSLMSALIFPLFAPLMIVGMFQMIEQEIEATPTITVGVSGAGHAPGVMSLLDDEQFEVTEVEQAQLSTQVREGTIDVGVAIPADYGEKFREGWAPQIFVYRTSADRADRRSSARVAGLIRAHAAKVGTMRMVARGISPALANPIEVTSVELSSDRERSVELLSFVPMLVLLSCFMGGMYVAMDMMAGERERGSLEPLLLSTRALGSMVLGKLAVAVAFGLLASTITLAGCLVALGYLPSEQLGMSLDLEPWLAVSALAVTVPLTCMASALQLLVSTFSRTIKEAQTYLGLLMLLPVIPVTLSSVKGPEVDAATAILPVAGQSMLFNELMAGRALPPSLLGLSVLVAFVIVVVSFGVNVRLLRSERVIFGRS